MTEHSFYLCILPLSVGCSLLPPPLPFPTLSSLPPSLSLPLCFFFFFSLHQFHSLCLREQLSSFL